MSKALYMQALDRQEAAREAGPALLVALKELMDLCEYAEFECRDLEPYKFEAIVEDTLRQARDAISKATGEPP